MGSWFFCLPCSISAAGPTQSGFDLRAKHWAVQEICACRAINLISGALGVQQSAITPRQLPPMQLLLDRGRDFLPLCVPSLLPEPCVCEVTAITSSDLPSSLICTYFFLAAYFLQAFWMALAYPSYFLSLISSNRNSCTKRQWGQSNILHAKFKKKLHFILNNSPVHFTLDRSWCLFHNCGIWDWNVKVALLEEISDAWVAVALTSQPIKFPMLKEEEYGFSPKYSTGAMQGSPTGHFFSLHPHILQNSYFPCQNVPMSVGSMCNMTVPHKQLPSLAEFHTLVSTGSIPSHHWRLSAACRTSNYGLIIHKYDLVWFLGLKFQKSRENTVLLKQEWKVHLLFQEFPRSY